MLIGDGAGRTRQSVRAIALRTLLTSGYAALHQLLVTGDLATLWCRGSRRAYSLEARGEVGVAAVPPKAAWERGPNSTDQSILNPTEEGIQE